MDIKLTWRGGWLITLTQQQMDMATYAGQQRYEVSRENNFKNLRKASEDMGDIEQQGAMGEMAVAILLNLFFDPTPGYTSGRDHDLVCVHGLSIDAKATRNFWGMLSITPRKRNDFYVLVICEPGNPECEVLGYIEEDDAKQDEFWNDAEGQWVVPQKYLSPIEDMVREENPPLYKQYLEMIDAKTTK